MTHTLGIEFGSTRIKAVLTDEAFHLEERPPRRRLDL